MRALFGREKVIAGFSAHRVGGGVGHRTVNSDPVISLTAAGFTPTALFAGIQNAMNAAGPTYILLGMFAVGLGWVAKTVKRGKSVAR